MVVDSSNLCLRFYKCAGWTRKLLDPYLVCGHLRDTELTHGDRPEYAYFACDAGARLNIPDLYRDHVTSVNRTFNDRPYGCR